jgi:FMN phosphatase YigB (HAD superfamily)
MATERVWLFDLDNTLHDAAASAFGAQPGDDGLHRA